MPRLTFEVIASSADGEYLDWLDGELHRVCEEFIAQLPAKYQPQPNNRFLFTTMRSHVDRDPRTDPEPTTRVYPTDEQLERAREYRPWPGTEMKR